MVKHAGGTEGNRRGKKRDPLESLLLLLWGFGWAGLSGRVFLRA